MTIYFEIGPLKEREYTGIAQVTAALCGKLLGDTQTRREFFFGRMVVPKQVVEGLLKTRNGELLEWYLQRTALRPAPLDLSRSNAAVFPNRKTARRAFSRECQIIHDLSTLLTPQFHHADTIDFHATTMEEDILTNDITFCVSEATRSDVLAYFPAVAPDTIQTMPLAASEDLLAQSFVSDKQCERYVLVLGTIEPRKNASLVLRFIQAHPLFSKRTRIIFLGRFGWGTTISQLLEQYDLQDQHAAGRIVFPGFVTERVKSLLIRNAKLLVYPSLFEGFGLPVLEAATLGVPCVTTRSSSLPEVAGPQGYYFDPFTAGDFERVLMKALVDLEINSEAVKHRSTEWAKRFSWDKTYALMKGRIQDLLPSEH